MPKKFICSAPGCRTLLDERGYCDKHKREPVKREYKEGQVKPFEKAIRYNTELYNTQRWRDLRIQCFERDDYRCTQCGLQLPEGLEAHHIIRPMGDEALFFNLNNLRCVCKACHQRVTQKQTRGE